MPPWMEAHPPPPPVLSLNSFALLMVESLWLLVWSSVHCYKEQYESDSTSSKQASADPDFTSGLSTAGARLKKVSAVVSKWWMEWNIMRSITESGCGWTPPDWDPVKPARGTGPSKGNGCGIALDWSDGTWRPGRWTRHQCYNGWTASGRGCLSSRQPMWLPKTSSTGRRW